MPIRVLNVAEKPSVAKEVSRILSNGGNRSRRGPAQYNPIHEFPYNINGQAVDMVFTSVAGHLMELDFSDQHRRWHGCPPADLYSVPVHRKVPEKKKDLRIQLEQLAMQAQWLVLWLDCDREGEAIGFEVMEVCLAKKRSLVVKRARFSALIQRDLVSAVANLGVPNANESAAVEARQEIDLRVGASFTRFQTLLLQNKFDWSSMGLEDKILLSYGPCQFPTLGLIVQRSWEIQSHVPEPFWQIQAGYKEPPPSNASCTFEWMRGRLFDEFIAAVLYEACSEEPIVARVVSVRGRPQSKWPPYPLSTLEMQKRGTHHLRMPGERIMKLAEELYQAGFISYPRTETDVFSPNMDLMSLIQDQAQDARWGAHAQAIANGTMWQAPRAGGHDDKAHPPIHPVKYSPGENNWSPEKKSLYDFIVRSFLATCSKDAVGHQTDIVIDIRGEGFITKGLMVTQRNWLDVYPWASWGGNDRLPTLTEGQTFVPTELVLKKGNTQPPPRLFERDLIAQMERHGIGTDATVAEHIQKQLDRGYAEKDAAMAFQPTVLGEALITGYRSMGLDDLWKPNLRGRIEQQINAVAEGRAQKDQVLANAIDAFKDDFILAQQRGIALENEISNFFPRNGQGGAFGGGGGGWGGGGGGGGGGGNGGGGGRGGSFTGGGTDAEVGPCSWCGGPMMLSKGSDNCYTVCCSLAGSSGGACSKMVLPRGVVHAAVKPNSCCNPCSARNATGHPIRLLEMRCNVNRLPVGLLQRPELEGCLFCDDIMQQIVQVVRPAPRAPASAGGRGGAAGAGPSAARGSNVLGGSGNRGGRAGGAAGTTNGRGRGVTRPRGAEADDSLDDTDSMQGSVDAPSGRRGGRGSRAPKRGRSSSQAGPSTSNSQQASQDGEGVGGRRGAGSRGSRGGGRRGGARGAGRGGGGGAASGSGSGLPCCPLHGEPCVRITSRSERNPGRTFLKCANKDECNMCLKFLWEDEWDGSDPVLQGGGGRGADGSAGRGAAGSGWGGSTGAAARGGGGGGRFVSSTGQAQGTCFHCHQPGHWSRDCPNR